MWALHWDRWSPLEDSLDHLESSWTEIMLMLMVASSYQEATHPNKSCSKPYKKDSGVTSMDELVETFP